MSEFFTRLGFGFLWLFHWLPLCVQAAIGNFIGRLAYHLAKRRKHIARRNLELCFPGKNAAEIQTLLKRNLQASTRAALEHGLLVWGSEKRLKHLIRFEDTQHLDAHLGKPLILMAPHFVGLDMGGVRMTAHTRIVSMFSRSRSAVVDRHLLHARSRFNQTLLASKHDGIRPIIGAIRSGLPFYYLPDQDAGRSESIFVPFFGIPTATVPALSRLARVAGAKVVPAITRQLPGGQGYVMKFYPAWEDFPSGDIEADTRRMNAFIENRIREMPEQYLWTHRRFKTRPEGQPSLYD
jgi:KDO2-lipid IV(A) lauroyltransferase